MDAHVPQCARMGRLKLMAALSGALLAALVGGSAMATEPVCSAKMVAATAASMRHPARTAHESACRALSASAGQAAVALVFVKPGSAAEEFVRNAGILDLAVAVVDADGKVLRRFQRADVFANERERFDGISVDTGRYDLAPGVRAFGVRARNTGTSPVDLESREVLSLYVDDGSALREVLTDLPTMNSGGMQRDDCDVELSRDTRTIDLGPGVTKGMRDLVVTIKTVKTVSSMKGQKCVRSSSPGKTRSSTLRYDGQRYVIPTGLDS